MIRKKKLLLMLIPIAVVLDVAIIVTIMLLSTDALKSDRELFWNYFAQNVDVADFIFNNKLESQYEFKQNNSYTSNGNLSLVIEQGENSSKQLNATTNARHDQNTSRTYAEAILKNGDIDLFKVSYINSGDIYGIKCDEIFPNYVGIQNADLSQLASNFGIPNSNIPNRIVPQAFFDLLDLTDEQKAHLQEVYIPIINNKIQDTQFAQSTEYTEVYGVGNECNVYTLVLTSDNIKEILRDILSNAKLDNQTMTMLTEKFTSLEMSTEYTDANNLQLKIDQMTEEVENMQIENNLEIKVYENEGQVVKTTFSIGGQFDITYEKMDNAKTITIETPSMDSLNATNAETINNESTNEIIDLSQEAGQATGKGNTRIVISVQNQDMADSSNVTMTSISVVPDVNDNERGLNINLTQSMKNEDFTNYYDINVATSSGDRAQVMRFEYDTTTRVSDQIEEIEELNGNNTAIANYYQPEEYMYFWESWSSLFRERFLEKLATLGFYDGN